MSSSIVPVVKSESYFTNFYNTSADVLTKSANWVKVNGSNAAAGAGEALKNVWAAVSTFFTVIAQKVGAFLSNAKDTLTTGFMKAREGIAALPKEGKIAAVMGMVTTAVVTALCCQACKTDKVEVRVVPEDKTGAAAPTAEGHEAKAPATTTV